MSPALGLLTLAFAAGPAGGALAGKGRPSEATPAPREADRVAQAKLHYNKGTELFAEGKYQEAVKEFEAAIQAKPHPFAYYNLARCYEQLGDRRAQLHSSREYLRLLPNAEERPALLKTMTALEAALEPAPDQQMLEVISSPDQAEVWIDSVVRGLTPFRAELAQGAHELTLVKPGYDPMTQRIEVGRERPVSLELRLKGASDAGKATAATLAMIEKSSGGGQAHLEVKPPSPLAGAKPAAPAPPPRKRLWTWVAGGVAVAAAGTAITTGYLANKRSDEMTSSVHDQATVQRLHDQARSYQRTSNIFFAVAAGAGATGVTLYFVEGRF